MSFLDNLLFCDGLGFAVAHAGDVADEAAELVGDANLDRGNLGVVGDVDGLGTKGVALVGTRHKHDAVADAEGELSAVVHQRCYGQVGKGEQCAALAHMSTIQMFGRNGHLGHGVLAVEFGNPTAGIGGKTVVTVQEFLYVHFSQFAQGSMVSYLTFQTFSTMPLNSCDHSGAQMNRALLSQPYLLSAGASNCGAALK